MKIVCLALSLSVLGCGIPTPALVACSSDVCFVATDAGCFAHQPVCCDPGRPNCGEVETDAGILQLGLTKGVDSSSCTQIRGPNCK